LPYSSNIVRGVVLLCFPPTDAVLLGIVRRLAESAESLRPRDLEESLRPIYPNAVVRARDSLASFAGPAWYVYRDGRYSPYDTERWWDAPETAQIVLGPDGRYLDANAAALAILNCDLQELLAASPGDFTVESYRPNVPWVMQLLRDTGELHSTVMMQPRGDRPIQAVEYHLVMNGDGQGNTVSWIRPVPNAAVVDELEIDPIGDAAQTAAPGPPEPAPA
jgi:hypothetical protein